MKELEKYLNANGLDINSVSGEDLIKLNTYFYNYRLGLNCANIALKSSSYNVTENTMYLNYKRVSDEAKGHLDSYIAYLINRGKNR